MVTTPYILVNCTMQQSVNGNNKHKVKLVTTRGGWYWWWWWWGWRIFLLAINQRGCIHGHFSGWLRADLMRRPLLHQLSFFFFSSKNAQVIPLADDQEEGFSANSQQLSCLTGSYWGEEEAARGSPPPRRTHPGKIMKQLSNFDRLSIGARSTLAKCLTS